MNPFFRVPSEPIPFDQITTDLIAEAAQRARDEALQLKARILETDVADKARLMLKDEMRFVMDRVLSPLYLLNETHPDATIRSACQQAVQDLFTFLNALALDEELFQSLDAFNREVQEGRVSLDSLELRYLDKSMDYYLKNGFKLSAEDRTTLQEIDDQLSARELQFNKNISECNDSLIAQEAELDGLTDDFKSRHRQPDGTYKITVQTPSYMPVMKFAKSEDLRKRLYYLYNNRAKDKNGTLLEEILELRSKRTRLLGHDTFAKYQLDSVMAKEPGKVWDFYDELSRRVVDKAQRDYDALKTYAAKGEVAAWDKLFVTEAYREAEFQLNEEELKAYFPLDRALDGIFSVAQTLYDIEFREHSELPVWHDTVRAFEVVRDGKRCGLFYLDFFPRENKYSHAACFDIQPGKRLGDGEYATPTAALVCNFTEPSENRPSLLTHNDVETLFHEFGHLMHQLLTTSPLSTFAGTNVMRDFVEMPSQIMEHWVWERASLKTFARHYQTGEVIPDALVDKLLATKHLNSGINTQQQLFYGVIDMTLHDRYRPGEGQSINALVMDLQREHTLFEPMPDTHFEAGFGHLVGYAAGYYGYLWSRVFADDMFSRFKQAGLFDTATGRALRDQVLAKGNTEEPMELIQAFLGREPNMDAFLQNLGV
ncbi:Zn-dependent oligopeptidase [Sulfidibacter corallicola]|uniref:Zn-dependent oligopeptidase n=1 Tax=Sulfidibacter corallicola TaxID=2818388 RepID=A0A8A4TI70_SULCO|nr:M3 family metallopeptidase [Sulfidibacter corallicola]QTD49250.1 Zn-dependent oligopeptidase [Sulfidibacter corallicola]